MKDQIKPVISADWNICPQCGVSRVSTGNYPECNEIIHDMPTIADVYPANLAAIIQEAFFFANKARCQFLNWLVLTGQVIASPQDGKTAYTLPEGLSLRPEAMRNLENEILESAEKLTLEGLKILVEAYCNRAQGYYLSLQDWCIGQTAAKVAQALRR